MTDSMYHYVLEQLQESKGRWPTVAKETGIPLRSLEKIARREFKDPGVSKIETLARYFRNRGAAPANTPTALRA